jgi:hypothetical protein
LKHRGTEETEDSFLKPPNPWILRVREPIATNETRRNEGNGGFFSETPEPVDFAGAGTYRNEMYTGGAKWIDISGKVFVGIAIPHPQKTTGSGFQKNFLRLLRSSVFQRCWFQS